MWRQSDRSLAAAAFFFAGGLFSLINATVFRLGEAQRPDLIVTAALCFGATLGVLAAGERFSRKAAGVLMSCALLSVVPGVLFSASEMRVLSLGFLFFPYFIFLVWFLPLWFARLLAYTWLTAFCAAVLHRYGIEPAPVLIVLVVSGVFLGELVGRFKQRIEREAVTDPLCGVWNRRGFEHVLAQCIAIAGRSGRPLSLLYLDLDGFKAINDGRGHLVGDQTLRRFADEVSRKIRAEDVLARMGGDEFVVLFIDRDAERAREAGERLRRSIIEPSWSFGVAEWRAGETPGAFISRADLLMLDDKQRRKAMAAGTA